MLLTQLLLPHLERSQAGRVIFVSSSLHDPDERRRIKGKRGCADSLTAECLKLKT